MDRSDVEKKVSDIFETKIGVKIPVELYNEKLLQPKYGLQPRDLFALFHELQDAFGIKFVGDDLTVRRFDVFSDVVDSIMLQI